MGKPLKSIKALAGIFLGLSWNLAPAAAATITAASPSYEDVSAAVSSASNGDTVQVPAGSATWSSTLNLGSKAIQLIGNGVGNTIINNGVGCLIRSNSTGDNLVRISGFRFNSSDNQTLIVSFSGPSHKTRVDHCYFNKGDAAVITNYVFGGLRGSGPVYGVVDHCTFLNMSRCYFAMDGRMTDSSVGPPGQYDGAVAWQEFLAAPSSFPGSDKMMYFEDNTFTWDSNLTALNAQGALYGQYGGKCCFRYNTCTGFYTYIDAHGDNPSQSTIYYEIYNNTFTENNRWGAQGDILWQRGGQWIVHDNTFVGGTLPLRMSVYWESDAAEHRVENTYIWGNTKNGNTNQAALAAVNDSGQTSPGYSAANIRLDQEYFLHAPTSGQTYYPYTPLIHPHPLVTGAGGPSPTPPPTQTATPTPTPPILGLSFDAPAGVITAPFTVAASAVSQALETSDPTQGGRASYTFAVPTAGDYLLSALVNCPTDSSNSFFVNIDAEPSALMIWHIPVTAGSETRVASWPPPNTTPKAWTLTAGTHQLIFRGREANTILQHITLGIAPNAPQGLHTVP